MNMMMMMMMMIMIMLVMNYSPLRQQNFIVFKVTTCTKEHDQWLSCAIAKKLLHTSTQYRKVLNFTREDYSVYCDGLLTVEDTLRRIGIKTINNCDVLIRGERKVLDSL
jgi:hypothetical protein